MGHPEAGCVCELHWRLVAECSDTRTAIRKGLFYGRSAAKWRIWRLRHGRVKRLQYTTLHSAAAMRSSCQCYSVPEGCQEATFAKIVRSDGLLRSLDHRIRQYGFLCAHRGRSHPVASDILFISRSGMSGRLKQCPLWLGIAAPWRL